MLPRVFELFTQAEQPAEHAHGGLGIGLALARRLVEMHGGAITGHSDGLETRRRLHYYDASMRCGRRAAVDSQDKVPHIASRVVIIEDNRDAAHTLSMLVEQLGGSARIAHDAPADSRQCISSNPTSCFWISACLESMDTKRVVGSGSGY